MGNLIAPVAHGSLLLTGAGLALGLFRGMP
jgi:hypothetical protein